MYIQNVYSLIMNNSHSLPFYTIKKGEEHLHLIFAWRWCTRTDKVATTTTNKDVLVTDPLNEQHTSTVIS